MNRRKVLSTISVVTVAGLFLPTAGLFSACKKTDYQGKFFKQSQIDLLNEIGETILPETDDSPGAKAAMVGNFMDAYVADCYTREQQDLIQTGLATFSESCEEKFGESFNKINADQRHRFLVDLDASAKISSGHYFSLMKSTILFSYFTSAEGATKALRYVPIPGKYVGDFAFAKGDKAWAL